VRYDHIALDGSTLADRVEKVCHLFCGRKAVLRNKYSGPCRFCGKTVEAGQGNLMGEPGNWKFSHDHCIPAHQPRKPVLEYDL